MQHGARTSSGAPKKLFAGIAALGVAAGAYGVYATTLSVNGAAGTNLQAGTSAAIDPTNSCITSGGLEVSEKYVGGALDSDDGYTAVTRPDFVVKLNGTATDSPACNALVVRVAVKIGDTGVGENVFSQLTETTTLGAIRTAASAGVELDSAVAGVTNWGMDDADNPTKPIAAVGYSIRIGA